MCFDDSDVIISYMEMATRYGNGRTQYTMTTRKIQ